jgi:hypothetical protein
MFMTDGPPLLDEFTLIKFVNESNAIENIWDPPYGVGSPEFDDHLVGARRVAAGTLTDFLRFTMS